MDFITHQNSLPLHGSRQLGALSSGRGTQIQNALSRTGIGKCRRGHCTGLLYIINTGLMKRMPARLRRPLIIKTRFRPWHRTERKRRFLQKPLCFRLKCIDPKPLMPLFPERLIKSFIFLSKHFLHSYDKLLRKHIFVPFLRIISKRNFIRFSFQIPVEITIQIKGTAKHRSISGFCSATDKENRTKGQSPRLPGL